MLPVLISIPHGGSDCPPELADRVVVSPRDLFDDIDPFTREIYDLDDLVAVTIKADIARTFVDLNRAPEDRPPENPDGVVKTQTCYRRPIYEAGAEPAGPVIESLIATYHTPYHEALERAARQENIRLCLDCHSMSEYPPPIAPDTSRRRPLFCLSNAEGKTSSQKMLDSLASALGQAFECTPDGIRLNDPFKGGYITRRHGAGIIPWIQIEMNRSWYLTDPWFDHERLTVAPHRLAQLRDRFAEALRIAAP